MSKTTHTWRGLSVFKDFIVHKKGMKYFHEDVKGEQDGH